MHSSYEDDGAYFGNSNPFANSYSIAGDYDDDDDLMEYHEKLALESFRKKIIRAEIFGEKFSPPRIEDLVDPIALGAMRNKFPCAQAPPPPHEPNPLFVRPYDDSCVSSYAIDFSSMDIYRDQFPKKSDVPEVTASDEPPVTAEDCPSVSPSKEDPPYVPPTEKVVIPGAQILPPGPAAEITFRVDSNRVMPGAPLVIPPDKQQFIFPSPFGFMLGMLTVPPPHGVSLSASYKSPDILTCRFSSDRGSRTFDVEKTETFPSGPMLEVIFTYFDHGIPLPFRTEMKLLAYHLLRCNFKVVTITRDKTKIVPGVTDMPPECFPLLFAQLRAHSKLVESFERFVRNYEGETFDQAWYHFSNYHRWTPFDLLSSFVLKNEIIKHHGGGEITLMAPGSPCIHPELTPVIRSLAIALTDIREPTITLHLPDEDAYNGVVYAAALFNIPVFVNRPSPYIPDRKNTLLFLSREPGPNPGDFRVGLKNLSRLRSIHIVSGNGLKRLARLRYPPPPVFDTAYIRLHFSDTTLVEWTSARIVQKDDGVFLVTLPYSSAGAYSLIEYAYLNCPLLYGTVKRPKRWSAYVPLDPNLRASYPCVGRTPYCFFSFQGVDSGVVGSLGEGVPFKITNPLPWPYNSFERVVHIA